MADNHFGDWSIDQECFAWILANLPCGSTILELGSGWASGELSRYYKVYSVEDNENYFDRYNTNYIFADTKTGWYDRETLKNRIPKYDLLLIDGPSSNLRPNLIHHIDLFDWSKKVIIDDVREGWLEGPAKILAETVIKRPYQILEGSTKKKFMVIP